MTDSDREPQEDILKWSIRYVLIPVTLAVMAGYFALAVVDRQFDHQNRLPNNDAFAGIFATMTAAAANAQPTASLGATNTPAIDPTPTVKEIPDDKDVPASSTPGVVVPTEAPNPGFCGQVPAGWRLYTVQPGNTLFSLAQQTGTTIAAVQQANCLYGQLIAYSQIWLPDVFSGRPEPTIEKTAVVEPTITATPTATATATATATPTATEPAPLPDIVNGAASLVCFGGDNCVPTVSFAVANVGYGRAGAFNIQLQFASKPLVVLDQAVAGLEPGAVQTFTLTSDQLQYCYYYGCEVCITVDSFGVITEENEANNRFCPVVGGNGEGGG